MDCPTLSAACLDLAIPQMGVAQRRAHIGMAKQAGDHRHRHAVHHRVTGMGMAEIVKANVLDARLAPGAIPEQEDCGCGAGRDLSGTERRRGFRRAAGVRECAGPGC